MAPPAGLEPATPCINTPAVASLRQLDKFARGANIVVSRPFGAATCQPTMSLVESKKEKQNKSTVADRALVLAPPAGLEPATP